MMQTDGFIQWVINNMQVRLVLKDDPIITKELRICEPAGKVGANQANALALISTFPRGYSRVPFSSHNQMRNKKEFLFNV